MQLVNVKAVVRLHDIHEHKALIDDIIVNVSAMLSSDDADKLSDDERGAVFDQVLKKLDQCVIEQGILDLAKFKSRTHLQLLELELIKAIHSEIMH